MTTIAIGQQYNNQKQFVLVTFSQEKFKEIRDFLEIGQSGLPYLEVGQVTALLEDDTAVVRQFHYRKRRSLRYWRWQGKRLIRYLIGIGG